MTEEERPALEDAVRSIIERIAAPEEGYQSLNVIDVIQQLGSTDNAANRTLIAAALKLADERSKNSGEAVSFSSRQEFEKAMGIKKRRKR